MADSVRTLGKTFAALFPRLPRVVAKLPCKLQGYRQEDLLGMALGRLPPQEGRARTQVWGLPKITEPTRIKILA